MRWMLLTLGLLIAAPAAAVQPDEILDDPALEARAREISKELRWPFLLIPHLKFTLVINSLRLIIIQLCSD